LESIPGLLKSLKIRAQEYAGRGWESITIEKQKNAFNQHSIYGGKYTEVKCRYRARRGMVWFKMLTFPAGHLFFLHEKENCMAPSGTVEKEGEGRRFIYLSEVLTMFNLVQHFKFMHEHSLL
jgi:hypothetical protein